MASDKVLHLKADNFDAEVLKAEQPVLVDFWATWCGPCKMLSPVIDQLADEYDGKAKICKVDVDEAQELAIRYDVMSVPTIILFHNGEIADKLVGARPKQAFADELDKLLL